jgi:single-strand DNA-binding protein
MTSGNRVILTGKVAKPPQRSFRPDGSSVIQFSLELSDQDRSLIDIVAFAPLAEIELGRLQSGNRLTVEGHLKQRRWQTPEGKNRSRLEVIATDLQMAKGDESH